MKIYGFIGSGNMGSAMIGGLLGAGLAKPESVIAGDLSAERLAELEAQFGIRTICGDNRSLAAQADVLVLSVKPYLYGPVIEEIRDSVRPETVVIMIAAGQALAANEARFGKPVRLVRVMPNTPALVGAGMAAVCFNANITEEDRETVLGLLRSFGRAEVVPESLMDTVTAVSGSSPAYVYMFIEAMADAAVMHGMPRAQAYTFAAQAVLGSAKMVLDTGMHPGALKDNVCSPGGTTIAAVAALERGGMRAAVLDAMDACVRKSEELSR